MAVYLISLFFVYFFLTMSKFGKAKENKLIKKIGIIIPLLILTIIAGIRYNVGTDFLMYESFFYNSTRLKMFSPELELVFVLFCKILHLFFSNSAIMFLLIALLIYSIVFKSALKNTKLYELCIFLFIAFSFYTNSFNVLRQWMAIPLLYLGMDYINEKKWKKGVPILIIGILCHYTSIVTITIYFICKNIKKDITRIIIIITSIIIYVNLDFTMQLLYKMIVATGQGTKYYKYFTKEIYTSLNTNILVMPMFTLLTYLGYLILVPNIKKMEKTPNQNFLINTLIFGFTFSLLGTKNVLFQRLQLYFIYPLIFVIPFILEKCNKDLRKIIYILCIIKGIE